MRWLTPPRSPVRKRRCVHNGMTAPPHRRRDFRRRRHRLPASAGAAAGPVRPAAGRGVLHQGRPVPVRAREPDPGPAPGPARARGDHRQERARAVSARPGGDLYRPGPPGAGRRDLRQRARTAAVPQPPARLVPDLQAAAARRRAHQRPDRDLARPRPARQPAFLVRPAAADAGPHAGALPTSRCGPRRWRRSPGSRSPSWNGCSAGCSRSPRSRCSPSCGSRPPCACCMAKEHRRDRPGLRIHRPERVRAPVPGHGGHAATRLSCAGACRIRGPTRQRSGSRTEVSEPSSTILMQCARRCPTIQPSPG